MIAQTAWKIREQMGQFSGNLSEGLCKVARRFVWEMIYGISARQSVHLSEVARSLEEPIALGKTENRLSRNLGRQELRAQLQKSLLRQAAGADQARDFTGAGSVRSDQALCVQDGVFGADMGWESQRGGQRLLVMPGHWGGEWWP